MKNTVYSVVVVLLFTGLTLAALCGCSENTSNNQELQWEHAPSDIHAALLRQELRQHEDARAYCATLKSDGKQDWRLPHKSELMDFAASLSGEATMKSPDSRTATCWSATPYHDSLLRYWAVSVFNKQAAPLSKDIYNAVICVRDVRPR